MKTSSCVKPKQLACAAILCLGGIHAASADIIFSHTQPPPGSLSYLVRYNTVGAVPGPALTVTGVAGPQNDRSLVDFSSSELLTAVDVQNVPPPYVRATDGSLSDLDISVRDSAFTSLFINFRANATGNNSPRYADILVNAFGDDTARYRLSLLTGNNLFRIDATEGTLLRNVSITGMFPLTDIWQTRVGGMQDAPPMGVPEPATLLSFGIGAAGLMAARRRRHQASVLA